MRYEYSIYRNEWCGWQLWRGQAGGFRHTQLVRHLLPESVGMMQRLGMLRRVGLSDALRITMPNEQVRRDSTAPGGTEKTADGAGESSPAPDGWPKLVEVVALVKYAVVIYADSEAQALEHVTTWEHAWDANADLIGVSDVEVGDVQPGTPEDAHEVTANR